LQGVGPKGEFADRAEFEGLGLDDRCFEAVELVVEAVFVNAQTAGFVGVGVEDELVIIDSVLFESTDCTND
jgi:hypothetical protein